MLLICVAACRPHAEADVGGTVRVTIVRLAKDTVRFTAPAWARRCTSGRGWIISGQQGGNGVLIWLRPSDATDSTGALKGRYPLRARDDTTTGRGAYASARYMTGETPHGLNLDAGTADLADTMAPFGAHLDGIGLEAAQAQQVDVVAHFENLRVTDTTTCTHS